MNFHFTVETSKNFDEAVEAVTTEASNHGMRVLHIHNVQETLNSKGFHIEPLKIIEVCSAKHAYQLLQKGKNMSLFMPCRISVFVENGKTFISGMDTQSITQFVPELEFADLAKEVNEILKAIVLSSK